MMFFLRLFCCLLCASLGEIVAAQERSFVGNGRKVAAKQTEDKEAPSPTCPSLIVSFVVPYMGKGKSTIVGLRGG